MDAGLAYLGGFISGGLVVFVVTARTVWKPMIDRLRAQLEMEKQHRLEREMIDRIPGTPTRADWPEPIPGIGIPIIDSELVPPNTAIIVDQNMVWPDVRGDGTIDLTGIDDVPYED